HRWPSGSVMYDDTPKNTSCGYLSGVAPAATQASKVASSSSALDTFMARLTCRNPDPSTDSPASSAMSCDDHSANTQVGVRRNVTMPSTEALERSTPSDV